jgi:hypothetical protein
MQLAEAEPRSLFTPAPEFLMQGEFRDDDADASPHYLCPSYVTSDRHPASFVRFFKLPSERPSADWVRRGAALVMQVGEE